MKFAIVAASLVTFGLFQTVSAGGQAARGATEVPESKDAPLLSGSPLTSVVVTQCNLIVAAYLTTPDGRLMRFNKSSSVPVDELLAMAYAAKRGERIEVRATKRVRQHTKPTARSRYRL
jgi:hypothetical protein